VWDYQVIGRHDYGDAWYMAYVGASLCGVGTGGQTKRPTQVNRRQVRHIAV